MRNGIAALWLMISLSAFAQVEVTSDLNVYKHWTIDFSAESTLLELSRVKNHEAAPAPVMTSTEVKRKLDSKRKRLAIKTKTSSYTTTSEDIAPELAAGYNGMPVGNAGIPNDNTMAISNGGMVISAINTTVTILNENGDRLGFRTLFGLTANQLGLLDRYYDPKVTYDPIADRFMLVFLEGSLSNDTRIVVGFTETNDPTGVWNFYALNGKPLGGATWSDYPIIAHNKTDLYITVNLLRDNESWQEGFVESLIWQVNKEDGYTGKDNLTQRVFSGITYGNSPVWSICPVQPALDFDQENMYLLSVRPGAEKNDTVFLHEITGSSLDTDAEHKLTVLTTDTEYGVPPTAYQPIEGFRLQTNDTRVLSATIHQGDIHYVQSTVLSDEIRSGIYHGIIDQVATDPTITGNIISSPTLDYAYPSISFAGESADDKHSMLLTFSHVGEQEYAGTSVVFHNKKDNKERLYSAPAMVKRGDSVINTFVADTLERWGDYTDIQRKYDEPGVVWACGSYGDDRGRNNVWIAKLRVNNELKVTLEDVIVYPNPVENSMTVNLTFEKDEDVTIQLVDMRGTVVKEIVDEPVTAGSAEFLFDITGVSSGFYVLSVRDSDGKVLQSQKILAK